MTCTTPLVASTSGVATPNDLDKDDYCDINEDDSFMRINEHHRTRKSNAEIKKADRERWELLRDSLFHTAVMMQCPPVNASCRAVISN